jgi:hypothetical protein
MSKASDNANAVVYAAEQVCGLYGVHFTREQSRMFNVHGTAGRWRPMFFGQWTDNFGKIHRAGKADLLARPRVRHDLALAQVHISVPLWIECKSGASRLTPDQIAFKNWVESNGDSYLLLHDDVRPLIAWFDEHKVTKQCRDIDLNPVTNPVDASILHTLPCKWAGCGRSRSEHIGAGLGCPGKTRKCWSPDLARAKG